MEGYVGFGFRPTDVELAGYYLPNKILGKTELVQGVINEVNICSFDPWELCLQARIKSTDPVWHFFSKRENKHTSGNRQSRTTPSGKWKLTGESLDVKDHWGKWCGSRGKIGYKRVLVFLRGKRNSDSVKSDWVMHEFHCTLLPEAQRTCVLCRLEYKGDDVNILSHSPADPVPTTIVPNVTYSTGSMVDQSVLGNSGSFNPTFSDYDSTDWFSDLQQSFVGTSTTSFNTFSDYGLANQDQQQFNIEQSVLGNSEISFNNTFSDSMNPNQWLSSNVNSQQQFPYSTTYENDGWEKIQTYVDEENRQGTSLHENFSDYRPKKPVTGVFADDISESDTESIVSTLHDLQQHFELKRSQENFNHPPTH